MAKSAKCMCITELLSPDIKIGSPVVILRRVGTIAAQNCLLYGEGASLASSLPGSSEACGIHQYMRSVPAERKNASFPGVR